MKIDIYIYTYMNLRTYECIALPNLIACTLALMLEPNPVMPTHM